MYYRTQWTVAIRAQPGTEVEVRIYTEAINSTEAIAASRKVALDTAHPGQDKEIVGQPFCVDVPGVTSDRSPEVRTEGKWTPLSSA